MLNVQGGSRDIEHFYLDNLKYRNAKAGYQ